MKRIESRSNPLIVRVGKLALRKYREQERRFFFEGAHLLEEYLRFGNRPQTVFVLDGAEKTYASLLERVPPDLLCSVPASVYAKLSSEQSPQGLLTVSDYLPSVRHVSKEHETAGQVLLLQSVRDNGNVGTVIRTAAALGWSVVLSSDCADVYAPKTVRATMGTLFARDVFLCDDPVSYVRSFRAANRPALAAALGERKRLLGSFPLEKNGCVVIGNEGQGVSEDLLAACDGALLIPMTADAESLNASVAAALVMWEGAKECLLQAKDGSS